MDRVKSRLSKKENWIVFAVFSILLIVVSAFHEPWFDEAQAWQIARCASFKEILFTIPHYEGHPPLWHLLLSVPAKLGMPYELSLKGISCLIAIAVTLLVVFKAPFPKFVRFLVPFGYFCFYQFGVISRPYQLLTLALLLTAICFKNKDTHCVRFVLCLIFLCLTSAYGVVLAGGVAIAWVIEILSSKPWEAFKSFLLDGRIWALLSLLLFALFLIWTLLPEKNTYAAKAMEGRFSIKSLIVCYFSGFTDSFLTTVTMGYDSSASITVSTTIISILLSLVVFAGIVCCSTKKSAKYFFIPYVLFGGFCLFVYMYPHHIGIYWGLVLFWAWITLDDQVRNPAFVLFHKLPENSSDLIKSLTKFFICVSLVISVSWSGVASFNEVNHPYSHGKAVATFIKEHNLTHYRIATPWLYESDGYADVNQAVGAIAIFPYLDENYFYTLNCGDDSQGYLVHKIFSNEKIDEVYQQMREQGLPEVIFGTPSGDFSDAFGSAYYLQDYVPVFCGESVRVPIWKWYFSGEEVMNFDYIYVHRDILDEVGLDPIANPDPYYYPYPIS